MNRRSRLAAKLFALAALGMALRPGGARGQSIEMPDGKPIPSVFKAAPVELDPITRKPPRNVTPTAWAVWVAYAEYKPRVRWESKSETETPAVFGSKPFGFLEKSYVLAQYQGTDGHEYLLLASGQPLADLTGVSQPRGWIPRDYVIDSPKATTAGARGVLAKAMLINDVERPGDLVGDDKKTFKDAVWAQGIPAALDDAAKQAAYRRKQYALFNIFWIFARTPNGPIVDSANDREQAWILIGNAPGITIDKANGTDDAAAVIQGWVPESRALLWTTREGLAWDRPSTLPEAGEDRRQTQGLVYKSADDAYATKYPEVFRAVTGMQAPDETVVVGSEGQVKRSDGSWVSAGYQPHHMRMPRLGWPGPTSKEQTKFGANDAAENSLIRVGSISGFDGLSAEQIADQNKKLDEIAQLTETTEILIVIDDTISMGKHFEAVAQAVERIQADAADLGEKLKRDGAKAPLIRAAVSYYNDTDGRPLGVKPYETMPLTPVAEIGASLARSVRAHKTNNGGDIQELVFLGLAQAIADAKFSAFARKLVFLIGDARDKSDPNDPTPARSVARLFRASSDSPIEFVSIQVVPPSQSDEAAGFDVQMRRVAGFIEEGKGKNVRKLGTALTLDDRELKDLISAGYDGVRADAKRIRQEIDQVRAGDFNTSLSEDTKKILEKSGINVDLIREQSKGKFQVYRPGYIWRLPKDKDGALGKTPQVDDVVLLNGAEVQTLIDSLNRLVEFNDQRKSGNSSKDAMKDLIIALIGDMYPKEVDENGKGVVKDTNPLGLSFQAAMDLKLGLSLNSSFLKIRPKDGQIDVPAQDIEDIAWKVQKLKDIVNGEERDWKAQVQAGLTSYLPGAEKRRNPRGFTIPGNSAVWYWLDAKDEIP